MFEVKTNVEVKVKVIVVCRIIEMVQNNWDIVESYN